MFLRTNPTARAHDISCQQAGQISPVGPTGAGKSTPVSLLPGFYEYTGGKAHDGNPWRKHP